MLSRGTVGQETPKSAFLISSQVPLMLVDCALRKPTKNAIPSLGCRTLPKALEELVN